MGNCEEFVKLHAALWAGMGGMNTLLNAKVTIILFLLIFATASSDGWAAARLIERITFEQPDGTMVELRGEGNEFSARYETLDGYAVIFVPEWKAYFYAAVSEDGEEFVS